jgi:hypothetical protein
MLSAGSRARASIGYFGAPATGAGSPDAKVAGAQGMSGVIPPSMLFYQHGHSECDLTF